MSAYHADRIETGMHIAGAIAGARAVAAWQREGQRQDAVRAQLNANALAAAQAVAAVERRTVAELRAELMEVRVRVAREQTVVDALEARLDRRAAPAPHLPRPTPEVAERDLRVALTWARAELTELQCDAFDCQDELGDCT